MQIRLALLVWLAFVGVAAAQSKPPTPPTPPAPPSFIPKTFSVSVTGQGRPVILIPGLACDATVWEGTIAHLGGKVRTHVLSLAGFAGRPPIAGPLVPAAKDEIIQYIKANHLDHPIVVGHSLGGFLAIWIAETAPDLIGGAVAVDGAPFLSALINPDVTAAQAKANGDAYAQRVAKQSPAEFKEGTQKFMASTMLKPADVTRFGDISAKSDQKTVSDAFGLVISTDLRPDLGKISARFLEIAADANGELPRTVLEKTWHAQIDLIPHGQLVFIDHAKHFVMLDQPEAFYAALDKYLAAK